MIEQILTFFFPPRLPQLEGWEPDADPQDTIDKVLDYHNGAGKVKPKEFRNGIERCFAEVTK